MLCVISPESLFKYHSGIWSVLSICLRWIPHPITIDLSKNVLCNATVYLDEKKGEKKSQIYYNIKSVKYYNAVVPTERLKPPQGA